MRTVFSKKLGVLLVFVTVTFTGCVEYEGRGHYEHEGWRHRDHDEHYGGGREHYEHRDYGPYYHEGVGPP